jgi:formylglycine-generating enzyme required for sulfatase activity
VTGDARAHEKFLLEKAQIDRLMRDVPIPRHSTSQQPWVACKNGRWQPHSQQVDVDSPVVGVERMWDIVPFIEWKNRRGTDSGWTYRLPTMAEWEQAARGADGRLYVWGDQFDWRLCNSQFARGDVQVDALLLEPRGRIPTDESVYGVRDLAGSAIEMNGSGETLGDRSRELTSDEYKRMQSDALPGPVQWPAWRGGSWVVPNPASFRAASRWPGRSDVPDRGLRLVAVPREDGTR